MTPFTTDDDNSSTGSHPFRRPRQLSKAGSLPSSPLGSYLHNGSSAELSNHAKVESKSEASTIRGYDATIPNSSDVVQLRLRDLERDASYSGYLTKFTSRTFFSRKQWKRRYFILHQSSLYCFKSSDPQQPVLESLELSPDAIICVTDIFSGKRYCLQITSPGLKNWYVLADTASEMSGWLRELKGTVLRFRNHPLSLRPGTHYSDSSEMSDLSSSSAMADGIPAMPSIPSQYDTFNFVSRSSSPPPRPPPPPQQLDLYQFSTTPFTPPIQDTRRRRKNSSISSGQTHAEYASFGTVMEQADALLPEGGSHNSHLSSLSSTHVRSATTGTNGRRVSVVIDRPETMITLPRRSSQRLMGSPARPMSPVSSRPSSPKPNRPSPRSSLVVTPPPRSIHRPSSISVRHSTQALSSQMANMSLQQSSRQSLNTCSLSRVTSLRLDPVNKLGYSATGSLQERTFRSPSRPSIVTTYSRPTSPTPSLSSPPSSPLPEPPKSDSSIHTLINTLSNGSSHRIQIVPRHHDPDQLLKHRPSSPRSRTKSQELSLDSKITDSDLTARANTPSPRFGATAVKNENDTPTIPPSPSTLVPKSPLLNADTISPPTLMAQQFEPPSRDGSPVPRRTSSIFLHHKHSISNSSLRSVGSVSSTGSSSTVPHGGAVSKKSSNRDSTLSIRLSNLSPIPLSTVSVPSPPQTALPPIPGSEKSTSDSKDDSTSLKDEV
ncbi:hypothetical protein BGZ49_007440 [Haplosporangium sp. Z 27]|nr:hypothetical protein BGZ49_007440 [Haplosporangium sp. Z 27]